MLMDALAVFLLLISNCIALWSESVECVIFDTAVVAQYMGGFFFGCQGPVLPSSQLCPFLNPSLGSTYPNYSHLKEPVTFTILGAALGPAARSSTVLPTLGCS